MAKGLMRILAVIVLAIIAIQSNHPELLRDTIMLLIGTYLPRSPNSNAFGGKIAMLLKFIRVIACCVVALPFAEARAQSTPVDGCETPITASERGLIKSYLETMGRSDAEDAIQYALIAFLKKCRSGEKILNPVAWVTTAAKNSLFNMRRNEKKRTQIALKAVRSPLEELGTETVNVDTALVLANLFRLRSDDIKVFELSENDMEKIRKELLFWKRTEPYLFNGGTQLSRLLTFEHLQALHAKYLEGMTAAEIASSTQLTLTTVQSRIRTGDLALRETAEVTLSAPLYSPSLPVSTPPSLQWPGRAGLSILVLIVLAILLKWLTSAGPAYAGTRDAQRRNAMVAG